MSAYGGSLKNLKDLKDLSILRRQKRASRSITMGQTRCRALALILATRLIAAVRAASPAPASPALRSTPYSHLRSSSPPRPSVVWGLALRAARAVPCCFPWIEDKEVNCCREGVVFLGPLSFERAQHRQTLRPSRRRDPQQSPASFRSAADLSSPERIGGGTSLALGSQS